MQWAQQTRDFTIRPGDPLRDEFIERLKGDDGCAFTDKQWTCFGDHRLAAAVLENMGSPKWPSSSSTSRGATSIVASRVAEPRRGPSACQCRRGKPRPYGLGRLVAPASLVVPAGFEATHKKPRVTFL